MSTDSADALWDLVEEKTEERAGPTQIALLPALSDPALVFVKGGTAPIVTGIKELTRKEAIGLSMLEPKDRKKLASLAHQVARSKTTIDDAGKNLKKARMAGIDVLDAERKWARESLEEFQAEIRKPLTNWEDANKARTVGHYDALREVSVLHQDRNGETVESVAGKLEKLAVIRARNWDEFASAALENCDTVELALKERHATLLTARLEAEELAKLRREKAERERAEYEAKIAREAAEKARKAAEKKAADAAAELARKKAQEEVEAKRKADEVERQTRLAEEERVAKIRREQEASDRAAREAQANMLAAEKLARELREQAEQDKLASEKRAQAAAEQAEREKKEAEERAVAAERKRAEDERAKAAAIEAERQANQVHRAKIRGEAWAVLAEWLDSNHAEKDAQETADKLLTAIESGQIPHVSINY